MTEEVWVHWHGSHPPGVDAASSAQQKNFANREEAAIFVMEEISEIDRPSAQMAVNRGQTVFYFGDIARMYSRYKAEK